MAFDVLYRLLRHLGHEVTYVRQGRGRRQQHRACRCWQLRLYQASKFLHCLLNCACRNFTDVDDKIIARAAAAGEDPLALSRRFIREFHVDMASLVARQAAALRL